MVDTATMEPLLDARWTALCAGLATACENGNYSTVRMLLEWTGDEGERVDPTIGSGTLGHEPIARACKNGDVRIVRALLDWRGPPGYRVDETVGNDKPLRFACLFGHSDVVRMLLDEGNVNPSCPRPSGEDFYVAWDSDPPEALSGAAANGHLDVVLLLLGRHEFPRGHVNRALEKACRSGFCEIARILVRTGGARPSECKRISISDLANERRFDVIRMLIVECGFVYDSYDAAATIVNLCASGTNEEFLLELMGAG